MKQITTVARAKRLFYSINGVYSLYFATANWLFWWRHYLSNGQIGLLDGFVFFVGLMLEIPSGAIADRMGRRRAMVISSVLMGIGYATTGFAVNGGMILCGYMVWMIGSSLFSGTDDAFMYDFLKTNGESDQWEDIARKKQFIRRAFGLTATLLGGFLFIWNPRFPSIVRGISFLGMLIPIMRMAFMDGAEKHHLSERPENYIRHIREGMRELLNFRMLPTVLLILVVQGIVISTFIGGILRPLLLERSSLNINYHAFFLTLVSLVTLPLLWRKANPTKGVFSRAVFWSVCVLIGFIMNIPSASLLINLLGVMFLYVGVTMLQPATGTLVNVVASTRHRATTISTANLLESLPYVILAPFIGIITDKGWLSFVVYGVCGVMFVAILLSVTIHKRQNIPASIDLELL